MPGLTMGERTIDETYVVAQPASKAKVQGTLETHTHGKYKGSFALRLDAPQEGHLRLNHVIRKAWGKQKLPVPYADASAFLQQLADAPAQAIGLDRINGQVCDIYKVPETGTLVWITRETELPVRITIRRGDQLEFLLDEFDYTPSTPADFFDLKPLPGYNWTDAQTLTD